MATGLTHDQIIQRGFDENNLPSGYYRSDAGGSSNGNITIPQAPAPVDFNSILQKAQDLQKQNNAPAISSLQAQIPEVQQQYSQLGTNLQAQMDPLKQRYQSLLDQIKGNQQVATNQQTITTNNELGRRGITGSSGLGQQEMTNALLPVTNTYNNLYTQTGAAQNQDINSLNAQIANLVPQQLADTRSITNAIAQLQAGGGQNAINNALQIGGLQSQMSNTGFGQNLAAQSLALQNAQQQFNQRYITIPNYGIYDVNKGIVMNSLNGSGVNNGGIQMINGVPYINQ